MNRPRDEHAAAMAAHFDRLAETYDREALRFYPFCADRLIALLAPGLGEKILDVAAGTGAVTLAAAQAVGTDGRVVAIDTSEQMLERLEAKLRHFRLNHVDIHTMDAAALEFRSGYFHHTVCGFGLAGVADMAAALRQWARVTRTGGKVMFTCHGPNAFRPMLELLLARLARHGVAPATERETRASAALESVAVCRRLLEEAGLVETQVRTEAFGYHLRPEEWWEVVAHSTWGALVERLGEDERAQLREAHLAEVAALAGPDGLWLDAQTHFAGGRKP